MRSRNELLEEIRLKEKSKLLFKGKFTSTYIISTESRSDSNLYKVNPNTVSKSFQPSPVKRAILIAFVCFVFFFVIQLQQLPSKPAYVYAVTTFLLVMLGFTIYQGYFNPKRNFSIDLNFEGITIRHDFYSWSDILETGILRIGLGRGKRFYLILVLKDKTYFKYPLFGFLTLWGFKIALSTYIEYFKRSKPETLID